MGKEKDITNGELVTLGFYKKEGRTWHAEVQGHTEAQNMMVAGADTFLDRVCEGYDRIYLTFSTSKQNGRAPLYTFRRFEHDPFGASYLITGYDILLPRIGWLCNVTHTLFGEHPKRIYVYDISPAEGAGKWK